MHLNSRSARSRKTFLLLVVGTVLASVVTAAVPSYSINTRQTGPKDDRGFPLYYTDNRGLHLRLCQSGTARCQGATRADLTPPNGENFYWMATARIRTKRGPIDVEMALEAAFGGARGRKPIVFDRLRIRGHLRQKGVYALDHPYGTTRFRAITPREQRNVDFTSDRFCSLDRKGRCSQRIDNFLRSNNPPKGFVGWGGHKTKVHGGTFRNAVVLRDGGKVIGRTSKFAILGKRFFKPN